MDFRSIIDLWPTHAPDHLAADIGAEVETVRKWRQRNKIPSVWWPKVCKAAKDRGFKGVTVERMAEIESMRLTAA